MCACTNALNSGKAKSWKCIIKYKFKNKNGKATDWSHHETSIKFTDTGRPTWCEMSIVIKFTDTTWCEMSIVIKCTDTGRPTWCDMSIVIKFTDTGRPTWCEMSIVIKFTDTGRPTWCDM